MAVIYESEVEEFAAELLQQQGYTLLSHAEQEHERENFSSVVLVNRLRQAINSLNADIPASTQEEVLRKLCDFPPHNITENNRDFHRMLTDGVPVEYRINSRIIGGRVALFDFNNADNNDCAICRQFSVSGNISKRPDLVLFVNGLPLAVIEFKNPTEENATIESAYVQLQNYKTAIPALFYYNGALAVSDGLDAKAGALTSDWSRFASWKTADGVKEDAATVPQLETLIKGMLRPDVLLDLLKHFTFFEQADTTDEKSGIKTLTLEKKIAAYHQYHAVNRAVSSTLRAYGGSLAAEHPHTYGNLPATDEQPPQDRKAGIIWHTQGSGKSLSMLFYAGKIILALRNPTLVILTDRNDLDDQLFNTFAAGKQLLRQEPVQAENRRHLKSLLKTAGGGVVFTTIQKFFPDDGSEQHELLSTRDNIVVLADEAHRTQYGFGAKVTEKNGGAKTSYGFAKFLRDALPHASFIGFTATPIDQTDKSTWGVFGNYVDIYDIQQAVADGATVPIYYESRLVQVHLKDAEREKMDAEVEAVSEQSSEYITEKAKKKWSQLEAIVGHAARLKRVAADIVSHFTERSKTLEGKAMIVTMSRRIAVELYNQIIALKPDWRGEEGEQAVLKIVMTASSSDPPAWQPHHSDKQMRRQLAREFKDPRAPFQLVIVCDMWQTGFDVPCLHTMYVDKLLRGHNLLQAIARVNRVYKDKSGGLIVDYIGVASELKAVVKEYSQHQGRGNPAEDKAQAIALMQEKYEVVTQLLHGCNYKRFFNANTSTREKLVIILEAQEHVLGLENGKARFVNQVQALSKAYALSVPSDQARAVRDEVGFFQAVKARLVKFEAGEGEASRANIDSAIRQIVDKAISADKVVDVFDAAGLKKPDISILSDEFMQEVRNMRHKNLAAELLRKLLHDEIRQLSKKNFIRGKKLSEMLAAVVKKYHNNLLTAIEVIERLIELAQEMRAAGARGEELGLSEDEVAFYEALADNDSARQVMGDETLCDLARVLVLRVQKNATIDWTLRENVRAKLRILIRRVLRQYGYPPDKAKLATENILKQAALFSDDWITR